MSFPVLFRSYGGENLKGRPAHFSKMACLVSTIQAAKVAGAELIFVNNGPIPEDRSRVMRSAGEIVTLPGVGVHESYLSALRLAVSGRWSPDQLVYVSEDDYLYKPESFQRLAEAARAVPEADYLSLYGSSPTNPHPRPDGIPHRPRGWQDPDPWFVNGQEWVRLYSTTATFGARVGKLEEDLSIFKFCTVPHRNMFRDHDTCVIYQGFEPYAYRDIARRAVGLAPGTPEQRLREVALASFYLASNLRSHRRATRRRLLIATEPNLATHVEVGFEAPGSDWAAIAAEALDWARSRYDIGGAHQSA